MIHEVLPNGAAAADGRLRVGDLILRSNDRDLRSSPHREAIAVLRQTQSVAHLIVYRDPEIAGEPSEKYDMVVTQLLKKSGKGLGLGIAGRLDNETGIFVSEVTRGGVIDSCGRVVEGDRILEVNGKDMRSVSHEEATNILKVRSVRLKHAIVC